LYLLQRECPRKTSDRSLQALVEILMKEGEAFEHPICKQPVQGPTKDCVRVEPVERERPSDQGDLVFVARVVRTNSLAL